MEHNLKFNDFKCCSIKSYNTNIYFSLHIIISIQPFWNFWDEITNFDKKWKIFDFTLFFLIWGNNLFAYNNICADLQDFEQDSGVMHPYPIKQVHLRFYRWVLFFIHEKYITKKRLQCLSYQLRFKWISPDYWCYQVNQYESFFFKKCLYGL